MDLDIDNDLLFVQQSGELCAVPYTTLIGCDGISSPVRHAMERLPGYRFNKVPLSNGYKELNIPASEGGRHPLQNDVLHIWPRKQFMLIALPNSDGSFTATLFAPVGLLLNLQASADDNAITDFFDANFSDTVEWIPDIAGQFSGKALGHLATIEGGPWHYLDKILLIGDAAHAMAPFYGQGMNCTFEGCRQLAKLIENNKHDLKGVFQKFSTLRKPAVDAIAKLSLDNYHEMSTETLSNQFALRKATEAYLYQKYGDEYRSQYSLVAFSDTPYDEILHLAKKYQAEVSKHANSLGMETLNALGLDNKAALDTATALNTS
jgi:kynurenine 3-monooxygenase